MTRQEAIEILQSGAGIWPMTDRANNALNKAIKALEQAPCEDANANQHNSNVLNDVGQHKNALEEDGNQTAKADAGKLQIHLVPVQIVSDIAEVRMYGNAKYGDPDNWKQVEAVRYRDALARHFLKYLEDPESVDEESGIKHLKHMACNLAFLCEMENKGGNNAAV